MTRYDCNKLLLQQRNVIHNASITREDPVAQRRKQRQSSAQHTIETDQKHERVRVHSVILVAVAFSVLSRSQRRHLLHSSRDVLNNLSIFAPSQLTIVPYSRMDAETAQ